MGETRARLTTRQAAFIGVASMVGAGIFSLLGAAGEVAGAAVWLSFLLAGGVALLQGYSLARFGARYPSAGGYVEFVARSYGNGHMVGVVAWMLVATNAIVTAMVAVSFGSYASAAVGAQHGSGTRLFAVILLVLMTALNVMGSRAVARVQTVIVLAVMGILSAFALVTLVQVNPHNLAFSGYPPPRHIIAGVALTFFAFLGFGVVTFTARDLAQPVRQLPRALYLSLGITTAIYVAVSLGVFGSLSVDRVIASGGTAIAVAAAPALGGAGYWLMTATALFATAGAANAGLHPATGLCERMTAVGQFPSPLARRYWPGAGAGLLLTAVIAIVLAVGFDLTSIASLGSAEALILFTLITAGHLRVRSETRAKAWLLVLGVLTTAGVLIAFVFTWLVAEPRTLVALVVIVGLSVLIDVGWKRTRAARLQPTAG